MQRSTKRLLRHSLVTLRASFSDQPYCAKVARQAPESGSQEGSGPYESEMRSNTWQKRYPPQREGRRQHQTYRADWCEIPDRQIRFQPISNPWLRAGCSSRGSRVAGDRKIEFMLPGRDNISALNTAPGVPDVELPQVNKYEPGTRMPGDVFSTCHPIKFAGFFVAS